MATPDTPRLSNSLTLAAVPTAVKLSRTLVAVTLKSWGLDLIAEEAELVISELATNAVKAAGPLAAGQDGQEGAHLAVIRVRIVYLETRIALEVWDSDPAPPKPADPELDAENGRGLAIIDALCARWDYVQAAGGGKVVFAELAIPPLPVTGAGLPIRTPEPIQPGPVPPHVNRHLPTLRRVHQSLKAYHGE